MTIAFCYHRILYLMHRKQDPETLAKSNIPLHEWREIVTTFLLAREAARDGHDALAKSLSKLRRRTPEGEATMAQFLRLGQNLTSTTPKYFNPDDTGSRELPNLYKEQRAKISAFDPALLNPERDFTRLAHIVAGFVRPSVYNYQVGIDALRDSVVLMAGRAWHHNTLNSAVLDKSVRLGTRPNPDHVRTHGRARRTVLILDEGLVIGSRVEREIFGASGPVYEKTCDSETREPFDFRGKSYHEIVAATPTDMGIKFAFFMKRVFKRAQAVLGRDEMDRIQRDFDITHKSQNRKRPSLGGAGYGGIGRGDSLHEKHHHIVRENALVL